MESYCGSVCIPSCGPVCVRVWLLVVSLFVSICGALGVPGCMPGCVLVVSLVVLALESHIRVLSLTSSDAKTDPNGSK